MARKPKPKDKDTIAVNRRARFDYDIIDTVEVGLVLTGTEVKSLRTGKASIAEAFATVRHGELWLVQANIPEYEFGNRQNHDPTRQRKLLAHRDEITELTRFTKEQGRTLIPLRLYWRDGKVKLLLGLAQGKALHDKRTTIAKRDAERQIDHALRIRQQS
jgi:SsrA-binding protein